MSKIRPVVRFGAALLAFAIAIGGAQAQAQTMPPPPMQQEAVPPPPPGPPGRFVWRPGHWRWDGRAYVWAAGRYVRPPHPHAAWVPGHWVERPRGWVWVSGHWR